MVISTLTQALGTSSSTPMRVVGISTARLGIQQDRLALTKVARTGHRRLSSATGVDPPRVHREWSTERPRTDDLPRPPRRTTHDGVRRPDLLYLPLITGHCRPHLVRHRRGRSIPPPCTPSSTSSSHAGSAAAAPGTRVVIAPGLTTVAGADQILVLDDGCITQSGTHTELLAEPDGRYARMWAAQSAARDWRVPGVGHPSGDVPSAAAGVAAEPLT
ncbi:MULTISPECIES: hypothetical protein [unclassified Streptomyces]|uniref:ABC transporter ATP-binding protein n=1 Tax=Streptomyces siderophoricus TaxID=2802281 RepID=A0ABS1N049_9ACTN|nr:hypothetical protein [Streptomyces sp. 9-7]